MIKMDQKRPEFNRHVLTIRSKWGRVTPFRLGMEVGRSGEFLPSPYEPWAKGTTLYMQGIEAGNQLRQRAKEQEWSELKARGEV